MADLNFRSPGADAASAIDQFVTQLMLRRRQTQIDQADADQRRRENARADEQLSLNRQAQDRLLKQEQEQADATKLSQRTAAAKIAVEGSPTGQNLTPAVIAQIQGTPYESRLQTGTTLPARFGDPMNPQTSGSESFTQLAKTPHQQQLEVYLADPNTPDNVKQFIRAQMASGDSSLPADLFKPAAPTSEPIIRVSRNGQVSTIGSAPTGAHIVNEPPASTAGDVTSPAYQGKLEQQYRQVLERPLSQRSGGLGLEDAKVNQAIHLKSLIDQYAQPNGTYSIPPAQIGELVLGLARLVSPTGQVGEATMHDLTQKTAQGDLAGALTYLTGSPVTGNTQQVLKMYVDSIDRQGKTAEANRDQYLTYLQNLAPTDLDETRRQKLEAGLLNSYTHPRGSQRNTAAPKVGDVVSVRGQRVRVTAIGADGKLQGVPVQ